MNTGKKEKNGNGSFLEVLGPRGLSEPHDKDADEELKMIQIQCPCINKCGTIRAKWSEAFASFVVVPLR